MSQLLEPVEPIRTTDDGQSRKRAERAWRYSYGKRPHVVAAYERRGRGGQVWLRWTNDAKLRRDRREYRSLGFAVRDEHTGRLDASRVKIAELAVKELHDVLLVHSESSDRTHRAPWRSRAQPMGHRREKRAMFIATVDERTVRVQARPVSLTLAEGFRLALDPRHGRYVSTSLRRYKDMRTFARRLFGQPGGEPALIDPTMLWTSFDRRVLRHLQRAMAERYIASGGKRFGVRIAEALIDAIYSVASWLRSEGCIPATAAVRGERWRQLLRWDWARQTGQRRSRCGQPRHTAREYRRIFLALSNPKVDPRIALAIELGAELRLGQVLRCTRTMLSLPLVEPRLYNHLPASSLGWIDVPDNGRKRGELMMFTPEQRRAVDRALSGFLSQYEAAWRRGVIGDYFLFPGTLMRNKRCVVETCKSLEVCAHRQPMCRTRARRGFTTWSGSRA